MDSSVNVLNEARGYYFEAYSSLESHEVMIKDSIRTMAYKRAVELNKHLFKVSPYCRLSYFTATAYYFLN